MGPLACVGFGWPIARNCLHCANEACDVLYAYSAWLAGFEIQRPLEITSGFRHLITNDYMTEGGVKGGVYMEGKAVDFAVAGVDVSRLSHFGLWLRGGGVGIYPTRNFVHVDSGRVRSWTS